MLAAYSGPAQAQDEVKREHARQLAAQGFEALRRKDYAAAEPLFRVANELVHAPTLLVDHARSLVGLGKLVEGHEEFALVLREGVADNAPRQWKKALGDAAAELAAVEPRLAWLTITVKGPQNPNVQIDGKPVPNAEQGIRRATNPGLRTIDVSADRFLPMEKLLTLQEGRAEQVDFALEPDPNAPPLMAPSAPAPEVIMVAAPTAPTAPDRTLATILLSAGGVGIATGAVTGFIALRTRSDLEKTCAGGVCTPTSEGEYSDYRQKVDRYRGLGTASGVAFAVGAGAALGGAALFLFTGKQQSSERPSSGSSGAPRASLSVGLGSVNVSGSF